MNWAQLVFAIALMILGGGMMAFNATIFWSTVVSKGDAPAVAPIFGGVMAAAGIAILPVSAIWHWAWLPLVLDWGGAPGYLYHWFRRKLES